MTQKSSWTAKSINRSPIFKLFFFGNRKANERNNRRSMSNAFSRRFQLHFLSPFFLHTLYFFVHIVFFLLPTLQFLRFFFLTTLSLLPLFFLQSLDGVWVDLERKWKNSSTEHTSFFFFDTASAWSLGAKRSNCCNFFSFFGLSLFAPSAAQPPPREGLLSRDREVLEYDKSPTFYIF